jgi:hypothetical protein
MGRPIGSTHPGLVDRLKRFNVQNDFAVLLVQWGPKFAAEVMGKLAEDGIGPDGHGWAYTYEQRLETLKLMFDRSYGRPAMQMTVDQTNLSATKIIHEVRWLPPDPNDKSIEIQPEPD